MFVFRRITQFWGNRTPTSTQVKALRVHLLRIVLPILQFLPIALRIFFLIFLLMHLMEVQNSILACKCKPEVQMEVSVNNSDYNVDRTTGMMETLQWRRQCPKGWREASAHYHKYRVQSSSIQVDLVPQPVISDDMALLQDTQQLSVDATHTDISRYGHFMANYTNSLGLGSDAVTTVASLHQQHFRMPGELYKRMAQNQNDPEEQRRIHLKRIITAGTTHVKNDQTSTAAGELKDQANYDPLSNYRYYPPADTTKNFHARWPKTKQYVIPGFVDKITPWSHPKKRHMFRASWKCPAKQDSEEREEYEAHLYRAYNTTAGTTSVQSDEQPDYHGDQNAGRGRTIPQREQMYILRLGGQDVVYSSVKDTLAQQSNHASHTFHIRVSYNVMFFERKKFGLHHIEETLDTTTDNNNRNTLDPALWTDFNNNPFSDVPNCDFNFGEAKDEDDG